MEDMTKHLTVPALSWLIILLVGTWKIAGLICDGIGKKIFKDFRSDYLTMTEFNKICEEKRNHCEVCRDVGDIKAHQAVVAEVLFDVASHLGVPAEKYRDLVGPFNRRRDDRGE